MENNQRAPLVPETMLVDYVLLKTELNETVDTDWLVLFFPTNEELQGFLRKYSSGFAGLEAPPICTKFTPIAITDVVEVGVKSAHNSQTFLVLGSTTLLSLREKIGCRNDGVFVGDRANPGQCSSAPLCEVIRECEFVFNSVVYGNEHNASLPMSDTIFADLQLRPNLEANQCRFTHLGRCEHTITLRKSDNSGSHVYPVVWAEDSTITFCKACNVHLPNWSVEDEQIPSVPAQLCDSCFRQFYNKEGALVFPSPPAKFSYCRLPRMDLPAVFKT